MRVLALRHPALELQSVDVRKFHVQDQASRDVRLRIRQVLRSGAERDRVHVEARKKFGQRLADPAVVIHDENDMIFSHWDTSQCACEVWRRSSRCATSSKRRAIPSYNSP